MTIIEKKMLFLAAAAAGAGVAVGLAGSAGSSGSILPRNENGEGGYEEEYTLDVEGLLENYTYSVEVPEQRLTEKEQQELLSKTLAEIETEFPGDNESVNHICSSVVIRDSYQGGRVSADWTFSDYDVIDFEGNVVAASLPEEGTLVSGQVELTCGDIGCSREIYFCVFPEEQTEQERLLQEVGSYLDQQIETAGAAQLELPCNLLGYQLDWARKNGHIPEKILALGLMLSAGIFLSEKEKEQKQRKERQQKLILEYPDMISKLALLLGAGMTVSGAWKRIAAKYENKRQNNAVLKMPLYEEMLITCHEMEGGVSEEKAYERFSERCGERRFRKLGSILTQNMRKGTRGLTVLLEKEVEDSLEERKAMARKYGEEAGTRMLFPMILMLGIVMAILIVPAVLSFQM